MSPTQIEALSHDLAYKILAPPEIAAIIAKHAGGSGVTVGGVEFAAAKSRANEIIRKSSLIDFVDAIEWAQWCRAVASAASFGDCDELEYLATHADQPSK